MSSKEELIAVKFKDIEQTEFFLDKDLRRKMLYVSPIIRVKSHVLDGEIGDGFEIDRLLLKRDYTGNPISRMYSTEGMSGFPCKSVEGFSMSQSLNDMGYMAESNTEKDKRIADLQSQIVFLQNFLILKVGISEEDINLIRKIRE